MLILGRCVHLAIDGADSLKEKRRVLRSLVDRLRRDFGLSVAEVGDHDLWNRAEVGLAMVGADRVHLESVLQRALDRIDANPEVAVLAVETLESRLGEPHSPAQN